MRLLTWRHLSACLAVAATVVFLNASSPVFSLAIPSAPPFERPIVDQTGTLTEVQIGQLSQRIQSARHVKDYQIGVLIIPTLGNDEYLEGYSLKVAREWGVGQKDKDNGVLILVVKDDRKIRIEVGRGLEGDLTDVESGRIIRQVMAPAFKISDYYGGIDKAIESISAQVEGRAGPNQSTPTVTGSMGEGVFAFIIFAIFWLAPWMLWIVAILARSKSWWAGGVLGGVVGGLVALLSGGALLAFIAWGGLIIFGLVLDFLVSRSYKKSTSHGDIPSWWAGGSWGGTSGGSWGGGSSEGGFGGGGFGGGGASGDW